MKRFFPKVAVLLVLITALIFLVGGTASAQSITTTRTPTHSLATACPPTLENGSTGPEVVTLQEGLNGLYNFKVFFNSPYNFHPPLAHDGRFGALTEKAVKDFQTAERITADGIVGPQTWHAMGFC